MPIKIKEYKLILDQSFQRAEQTFLKNELFQINKKFQNFCDTVFTSKTQAFREVLLGCLLTRIIDRKKDIHLPYIKMGSNAFSGRSLDEQLINPFLRKKNIPCSKGPYLSVFRRQVKFNDTTTPGIRDKESYKAFLELLSIIEIENATEPIIKLLDYVLYRFVVLREEAKINLIVLSKISLNQYKQLIRGLMEKPSGGIFPVVLVLAMIETIIHRFSLPWEVEYQEINVADVASGAGGDITVKEHEKPILTIEVTERPVDVSRVQATFKEKISAMTLPDYIFLVYLEQISNEAKQQADKYFVQGYDVNFVDIQEWIINTMATVGVRGRKYFQERLVYHLSSEKVPKLLKVTWNEELEKLTT